LIRGHAVGRILSAVGVIKAALARLMGEEAPFLHKI
jgi:hypothetical protein